LNEIYMVELKEAKPARSTIKVAGLPLGALVEIEMIAERLSAAR
jgi:enamine deaminase RidA (YjgF/YER057c/UK114 family)